MPPEVVTSPTPYATAADLLARADWRIVADWCYDGDGPSPQRASLLTVGQPNSPGWNLNEALKGASGEVESACFARRLYRPEDLVALTGNAKAKLVGLVCGLALWALARRRLPITGKLEDVPGAKAAADDLERLRVGEHVFGLLATHEAGAGMTVVRADDGYDRGGQTVTEAARYFGRRGSRDPRDFRSY